VQVLLPNLNQIVHATVVRIVTSFL